MKKPKLKTKSFTIRTLREWGILAVDLITVIICYMGAILFSQAYLLQQNIALQDILLNAFAGVPVVIIVFGLSFWRSEYSKSFGDTQEDATICV